MARSTQGASQDAPTPETDLAAALAAQEAAEANAAAVRADPTTAVVTSNAVAAPAPPVGVIDHGRPPLGELAVDLHLDLPDVARHVDPVLDSNASAIPAGELPATTDSTEETS